MTASDLTDRVRTAHGDAWQAQGRLREPHGGGAVELPGIRVMASGLPHAQWNNADVTDSRLVDVEAVRDWYAARGVPWGVRVPVGMPWGHGRHLFVKRLMGCPATAFAPAPLPPGCTVRPAGVPDEDTVVRIDSVAFASDPATERPWVAPHLTAAQTTVALAFLDDEPVGTGYVLRSDGRAGPCAYLAGVAVLPHARGRGLGAALSSWLVERALAGGGELAHLHPDTDAAARVYARLGFVEVGGFDVHVHETLP